MRSTDEEDEEEEEEVSFLLSPLSRTILRIPFLAKGELLAAVALPAAAGRGANLQVLRYDTCMQGQV
jgi:hypothetical protein